MYHLVVILSVFKKGVNEPQHNTHILTNYKKKKKAYFELNGCYYPWDY